MSDGFRKIKRSYLKRAIVASTVGGVAVGLICVGAVLLGLKLGSVSLQAGYYALIGLLPALLTGGLLFLILYPTDKKLAKKLDGKYGLRERVQTMLAYEGEEGTLPELQRRDASERLNDIYKKQPRFGGLWKFVALPVLAVALFLTAILVPAPVAPPPVDGDTHDYYEFTDWQKTALEQLIEEVKASSLSEALKEGVCGSLEGLLTVLDETHTRAEMIAYVAASAEVVEEVLVKAASYDKIGTRLSETQTTSPLSLSVSGGVFTFRSFGEIRSFENVNKIEEGLENAVNKKVTAGTATVRATLTKGQEEGLADLTGALRGDVAAALARSNIGTADPLYKAFADFNAAIFAVEGDLGGGYGDELLQNRIDAAFGNLNADLTAELRVQAYRCVMNEYVHNRLREIFALTAGELPDTVYGNGGSGSSDPNNPDIEPEDPDRNPDDVNNGGYGDGESRYGSDDLVYDPDRDEYVKYGELVNAFRAKALEQMRDGEAISEEHEKRVLDYFELLLSGIKEPEDDSNS